MRLYYFPVNAAYAFCLGGPPVCDITPTSMDGQMFFRTRKEAVLQARAVGLAVSPHGYVTVRHDAVSFA
jgi:hypothetical protein